MSRTIDEIYNSMKEAYEGNMALPLDGNSKAARVLEALSTELYGLYCYGDYILRQAFVQTADGENLDRLAQLRGITRKTQQKAQGELTFCLSEPVESDVLIQSGAICSVSGKPFMQYVTTEAAYIRAGELSVAIPAEAVSYGAIYNVGAGAVDNMVVAPIGISRAYNEAPFTGGYDTENDESLRMRIINHYAFDACGVNRRMLENAVTALDFVTDCSIPIVGDGELVAYVASKSGALTQEQKDKIRNALSVSELIGKEVRVENSRLSDFSLSIRLKVRPSYDKEAVEQKLRSIINMLYAKCSIGDAFSLEELEKHSLLIDGVLDATAESDSAMGNTVYCAYDSKLNMTEPVVSYYEA